MTRGTSVPICCRSGSDCARSAAKQLILEPGYLASRTSLFITTDIDAAIFLAERLLI